VLAYRIGTEGAADRLLLSGRPDDAARIASLVPPRLPISGGALVARGIGAGPLVAKGLKMVEDRWVAEGFPAAARVEQLADQVAAELLRDQ
jgi:poly(A) polymerase